MEMCVSQPVCDASTTTTPLLLAPPPPGSWAAMTMMLGGGFTKNEKDGVLGAGIPVLEAKLAQLTGFNTKSSGKEATKREKKLFLKSMAAARKFATESCLGHANTAETWENDQDNSTLVDGSIMQDRLSKYTSILRDGCDSSDDSDNTDEENTYSCNDGNGTNCNSRNTQENSGVCSIPPSVADTQADDWDDWDDVGDCEDAYDDVDDDDVTDFDRETSGRGIILTRSRSIEETLVPENVALRGQIKVLETELTEITQDLTNQLAENLELHVELQTRNANSVPRSQHETLQGRFNDLQFELDVCNETINELSIDLEQHLSRVQPSMAPPLTSPTPGSRVDTMSQTPQDLFAHIDETTSA
eukprot:m.129020 g.129020  ORF g.129020 m.129020 type:complete len:359 (-) comp29372_c2_seq2:67-1143(-)